MTLSASNCPLLVLIVVSLARGADNPIHEIRFESGADHTQQPAMFYAPAIADPVPLLVVLHTWHGDYKQTYHSACADWCMQRGWAYLHPDFRGPNTRPEATGSELVIK